MLCGGQSSMLNSLAKLLSRRSTGAVVPEMDGLRFPALVLVFLHHLVAAYIAGHQPFPTPVSLPDDWWLVAQTSFFMRVVAHSGFTMPMFFVISGFVLALPFMRAVIDGDRRPRLIPFYTRRLVRLEPPYLIALLAHFANLTLVQGKLVGVFLPHLMASAFYVHNLVYDMPSWVLGIAWSLEVEAQFYLSMPLLAWALFCADHRVRRIRLVMYVLAGSLLSQVYLQGLEGSRWSSSMMNYLHYFGAGFILADLYVASWAKRLSRTRGLWDAAGFGSLFGMLAIVLYASGSELWFFGLPDHWTGGRLAILLPWLAIVFYAAVIRGRSLNWIMTRRWIVIGGGMCYTVYLYHTAIFSLLLDPAYQLVGGRFGLDLECFLLFVLCIVPTLGCSAVLFVLIEKPFMGRRLQFLDDWLTARGRAG